MPGWQLCRLCELHAHIQTAVFWHFYDKRKSVMSYVNCVACKSFVGSPFCVGIGKLFIIFWKYEKHEECLVSLSLLCFAAVFVLRCMKPLLWYRELALHRLWDSSVTGTTNDTEGRMISWSAQWLSRAIYRETLLPLVRRRPNGAWPTFSKIVSLASSLLKQRIQFLKQLMFRSYKEGP